VAGILADTVKCAGNAQQFACKLVAMKKILLLASLALAGIVVSGRLSLGEPGTIRFLGEMENLMNQGKADEVCAMFHDDAEVSVTDRSVSGNSFTGGKEDLCSRTRKVAAALQLLPHSMNVEIEDLRVERSWLHPWTSTASYVEDRSFTIPGSGVTLRTLSKDTVVLVKTLSGVKLKKLTADVSLAD
jgi:hypothetical protein